MKTPNETTGAALTAAIQNLRVTDIVPDPKNRKDHDKTELATLATSIALDGQLQPIVVRHLEGGKFMLVAGERRWLAHQLLKRETIEARVQAEGPQVASVRKRHAENFHRVDLSPIQKAGALQELFDEGMTQTEVAAFVGVKDQSTVSNFIRLLKLPKEVQELVHQGQLTGAHAKALLRFEARPKLLSSIARVAVEAGASSKVLEKGLPFADTLRKAGIVHEFDYEVGSLKDLPTEYRTNPDFVESENEYDEVSVICLDPNLGKAVEKQIREAAEMKSAARSAGSGGQAAGGGMTETQKKERAAKIAKNRAARTAIDEAFSKARSRLERARSIEALPEMLHVVLEAAVADGRHGERLKPAAGLLGVELGARVRKAGLYRVFEHEELHALPLHDAVRVAALAVILRECEDAKRFSGSVPDSASYLAAAAVPAQNIGVGDLVRWKNPRGDSEGIVITPEEYGKATGLDWGKGTSRFTPVRVTKNTSGGSPFNGIVTESLIVIKAAAQTAPAKKQPAAKPTKSPKPKAAKPKKAAAKPRPVTKSKRAKIDDGVRSEVRRMAEAGNTGAEIAKKVGISLPSVQTIKKALGLVRARK